MAPKRKRQTKAAGASSRRKTAASDGSKVDEFFNQYRDQSDGDTMGPQGVEQFFAGLGLSLADRQVLLLAWRMGAKRMGYFTRQEFTQGLNTLGVSTSAQLKRALPKLVSTVGSNADMFSDFYSFAFTFCLTEPGQKIIDVDTAVQMLEIVLPDGRFVAPFCEFLSVQTSYNKLNLDQWNNFLRFSREVDADMSNASENPAWPVLIDEFVEWYQQKRGSKEKD